MKTRKNDRERGDSMYPVIPSEYPDNCNVLTKARMFKGYQVLAIFMLRLLCLL